MIDGILKAKDLPILEEPEEYFAPIKALSRRNADTTGVNRWDNVSEGDYGRFFDFATTTIDDDTIVLSAHSEAALQWCYRFLPADCPRYRTSGFVVEKQYIDRVVSEMEAADLIDEETYFAEMNNQATQWEEN